MTIADMVAAAIAVMAWPCDTAAKIGPSVKNTSSTAKMATLNMLLPSTLATAMSHAPRRIAARDTTTSGSDVDNATKAVPTNP